jgi:tRNA nucleotidyltransferase (CCA-adding enzyme)
VDTVVNLENTLTIQDLALLRKAGEVTHAAGIRMYLVGGSVRDAILGRQLRDLDLVAEAPAEEVARILTQPLSAQVHARSQFGTLKLHAEGRTLDLATSRAERYTRPGALPSVQPGPIEADLWRRDFSINAMAVALWPYSFGTLLDPTGGQRDVQRGVIRALHSGSFQDDATRILRAVRYATRLDFRIERRTLGWLKYYLCYLDAISPPRLRRELERLLEEMDAPKCLRLAHRLGVLSAVHPAFGHPKAIKASRHMSRSTSGLLALLTYGCNAADIDSLIERLGMTNEQQRVVRNTQSVKALEPHLTYPRLVPHEVADAVRGIADEAVLAASLLANHRLVRRRFTRFVDSWSHIEPALAGRDLERLGVPPGPLMGTLLDELRDARIDSRIRTMQAEIKYVKRWLRQVQ